MADHLTQVLGIVAMSNKGEYNSQTNYEKLNIVTYNGSSYCAKQNCIGILPTDPDYWQLLAERGDVGPQGEEGRTPVKGVDYFTAQDKNEFNVSIVNSVHEEVSEQVSHISNGSPLKATSMSDMTDTTRVYVNTTDGYVYYYDGSDWIKGWVYQTTEDSSSVDNLNRILNNILINEYTPDMAEHGLIDADGIHSASSSKYAKVPVTSEETYYLYRKSQIYHRTGDFIGFEDYEENLTVVPFGYNIVSYADIRFVKIVVPANTRYLLLNVKLNAFDETDTMVLSKYLNWSEINGYDLELRNYHSVHKDNYFNNLMKENIRNYIVPASGPASSLSYTSGCSCTKLYVTGGETYYLYRASQKYKINSDNICFGNQENDFDTFVELKTLPTISIVGGKKVKQINIPLGMTHIYINTKLNAFDDRNSTIFSKYPTGNILNASDNDLREYIKANIDTANRLNNKKWLTMGDSITALTYRSTKNYHDYISERTGCIVTNWGDSGKGYITGANTNHSMCDYCDNLTGEEGFDYITIFAGTNDRSQPLGTIDDTGKTTIYGAIKYCINKILSVYPNAKIGLMTPLPRSSNYGTSSTNSLYKIVNAVKEVGAYYSIPVLDQYTKSGLRPWNETNNETYFSCEQAPNGDGLHPNELGHEWISYPIENFLQLL